MTSLYQIANPCGLEPCKNGAKCFNDGEKYRCVCTAGFMGVTCVEREYIGFFLVKSVLKFASYISTHIISNISSNSYENQS